MQPVSFDQSNNVIHPPEGLSSEQCESLSAWIGKLESGVPVVVTCWKLTQAELEEIQKTKRVWMMAMGQTLPPIHVCGFDPFDLTKPDCTDLTQ